MHVKQKGWKLLAPDNKHDVYYSVIYYLKYCL